MARVAKLLLAVGLLVGVLAFAAAGPWGRWGWLGPDAGTTGAVRILRFYASVGAVSPGQSAMLCYGVENARSVHISPPVAEVYPAAQRCLEIVPKHTTHYTIWAEGFDGRVAMQSLTLPVETMPPAEPWRLNFAMWLRNGWNLR
jgi:hypothetical protein